MSRVIVAQDHLTLSRTSLVTTGDAPTMMTDTTRTHGASTDRARAIFYGGTFKYANLPSPHPKGSVAYETSSIPPAK